jgi:hypothetical protein
VFGHPKRGGERTCRPSALGRAPAGLAAVGVASLHRPDREPVLPAAAITAQLGGKAAERVWSVAANALSQVLDDAIRALEVTAAEVALAATGRQSLGSSVPIDERDSRFEPRLAHLLTFLKDQPGRPLGTGRRQPARAAAICEATGNTPKQRSCIPHPRTH